MLLPPLLLAVWGRDRTGTKAPRGRLTVAAVGAAAVVLFAWRAPSLPLDDLATRLRPGTDLAAVCAQGDSPICLTDVAPELAAGRWQVVLVDVEQDAEGWADALNRYADSGAQPPLLVLTGSPSDAVRGFTFSWGPSYPLREAPAALLRPLHRSLPRSFVSDGGRVISTSTDLPAAAAAAPEGDLAP